MKYHTLFKQLLLCGLITNTGAQTKDSSTLVLEGHCPAEFSSNPN